jgi:molecular chaperone GrpE
MQSSSDTVAEGLVVQEVQRGYRLGDSVLRHARVIVSTGPENSKA